MLSFSKHGIAPHHADCHNVILRFVGSDELLRMISEACDNPFGVMQSSSKHGVAISKSFDKLRIGWTQFCSVSLGP